MQQLSELAGPGITRNGSSALCYLRAAFSKLQRMTRQPFGSRCVRAASSETAAVASPADTSDSPMRAILYEDRPDCTRLKLSVLCASQRSAAATICCDSELGRNTNQLSLLRMLRLTPAGSIGNGSMYDIVCLRFDLKRVLAPVLVLRYKVSNACSRRSALATLQQHSLGTAQMQIGSHHSVELFDAPPARTDPAHDNAMRASRTQIPSRSGVLL